MTREPMAHRSEPDPSPLELLVGSVLGLGILLVVVIAFALAAPA